MGKVLLLASSVANAGSGSARYNPFGSSRLSAVLVAEANAAVRFGVAGTLSKLAVLADANGVGRSIRVRKATADANQNLALTDSTAGLYEDNVNTDAVAVGDDFHVAYPSALPTPTYYWLREVFEATIGHATLHVCTSAQAGFTGEVRYFHLGGENNGATSEVQSATRIRAPGIAQRTFIRIGSNTATTDGVLTSRKNGADGNIVITIPAGLTGVFEETTNTDTLASGDTYDYRMAYGTGGNTTMQTVGCTIVSSGAALNDIFAAFSRTGLSRAASATPDYLFIAGTLALSATEANHKVKHGFAVTARNLRAYVSANTYSSDATMKLRKNGADGNQGFTIPAGVTGWFEDTVNTDSFLANDDANISLVGGTSGSITLRMLGLTEGTQPPAFPYGFGAVAG